MIDEQRWEMERKEKWGDHHNSMDYIPLREGYQFKVIPPFGGALMRFKILHKSSNRDFSIYFDAHDALGVVGYPYFEVYPINDDTIRTTDVKEIMKAIYIECEGEEEIMKDFPELFI